MKSSKQSSKPVESQPDAMVRCIANTDAHLVGTLGEGGDVSIPLRPLSERQYRELVSTPDRYLHAQAETVARIAKHRDGKAVAMTIRLPATTEQAATRYKGGPAAYIKQRIQRVMRARYPELAKRYRGFPAMLIVAEVDAPKSSSTDYRLKGGFGLHLHGIIEMPVGSNEKLDACMKKLKDTLVEAVGTWDVKDNRAKQVFCNIPFNLRRLAQYWIKCGRFKYGSSGANSMAIRAGKGVIRKLNEHRGMRKSADKGDLNFATNAEVRKVLKAVVTGNI